MVSRFFHRLPWSFSTGLGDSFGARVVVFPPRCCPLFSPWTHIFLCISLFFALAIGFFGGPPFGRMMFFFCFSLPEILWFPPLKSKSFRYFFLSFALSISFGNSFSWGRRPQNRRGPPPFLFWPRWSSFPFRSGLRLFFQHTPALIGGGSFPLDFNFPPFWLDCRFPPPS